MNKYAVFDKDKNWLFDVHAPSEGEALALGQRNDPKAVSVELVRADRD